jgi:phosphopantothenoylcysteine decarboxylase / phosphopantothenate---cysteine ligase
VLITLGVASSISSYKSAEILRQFQQAGHSVRVAMTRNATRFIKPILFQSLSQHPVYLDEFRAKKGEVMHVELAREMNLLVVAPATASIIGKFAAGIADDFLTTLFLARRCPAVIAPAMNVFMYRNPIVQKNMELLKSAGVVFVEPDEGYLACGDEGAGRLAPEEEIVARSLAILRGSASLSGKNVLVTAGPTWEALDPVRILTNRSSGKMGYAIAEEAAARGARVTLISGPSLLPSPPRVTTIHVESAAEMKKAVLEVFDSMDFVIKAAAVSDFKPEQKLTQKKKKTGKPEILNLEPTEDILAELGRRKSKQILVGFCVESDNLESNAKSKLQKKNLDFIVANLIGGKENPFQSDKNHVLILDRLGHRNELPLQKKQQIAEQLWDLILERTTEIKPQPVGG